MTTKIERSGEGIGALMIQWVQDYAARSGISRVRWDVWCTNEELQDYYCDLGARHVRTVDAADRWSGALFEVPAEHISDLSERVRTE